MNTAADTVLQPLLAADPGAPLVTHYDLGAPSRIELSVTSTANWAAKIAGLLRDEVGVAPGDVVVCDLPAHWLTAGVLLGVWWAGAEVRTGPADDAVAVITTADRLERHPTDVETLLMTTDPMGRPLAAVGVDVPPGVVDL
ncbi:TIGR03089 family protein, partial [Dietzia sp. B44]|nr:TIGR03089 family protein [Dietzia sp. B44]